MIRRGAVAHGGVGNIGPFVAPKPEFVRKNAGFRRIRVPASRPNILSKNVAGDRPGPVQSPSASGPSAPVRDHLENLRALARTGKGDAPLAVPGSLPQVTSRMGVEASPMAVR
jgi:hypothetical protein